MFHRIAEIDSVLGSVAHGAAPFDQGAPQFFGPPGAGKATSDANKGNGKSAGKKVVVFLFEFHWAGLLD